MDKNFKNFKEAMDYMNEMKKKNYKVIIETLYDFNGVYYTVLVWK